MNKKTNILIIAAVIALLTLIGVQTYLILNTYNLKKNTFLKEVQEELGFLSVNTRSESWDDYSLAELKSILKDHENGLIEKTDVLPQFNTIIDSVNSEFKVFYQSELSKKKLPYKIEFAQYITDIIYFNEFKKDTLLDSEKTPILLFGTAIDSTKRRVFYTNKWFSESTSKENEKEEILSNESLGFEIKSISTFYVPDYLRIVLMRMLGFLILSVLSVCVVIGLFVFALLLLIKQKRIADVKTDFVNNITHELHTPLATLQVATNTLKNKSIQQNTSILNTTIDVVERQNKRLQNIINQVMTNALGHEEVQLNKEAIAIDPFLQTLVYDFKMSITDDVTIETNLSCDAISLKADKTHLASVINNILDNAVKYGGTHVFVISQILDKTCRIKIEDNGQGMPSAEQKRVFEKFHRVKTGNLHNVKGLGLGLFYVKEIVKAHKGTVTLKNNKNKGITVEINLPLD